MLFFVVLALTLSSSLVSASSWSDCGSDDAIVRFINLDLDDPIRIGEDNPIRISMNASQLGEVSGDSHVSVKINKVLSIFGNKIPIPVPCISGIGSCEMNLCEFFAVHRKLACAIMEAAGQECSCPTGPGNYGAKDVQYPLPISGIPSALLSIGNGDYSLDLKITNDDKQIACLKVEVTIKFV